MLVAPSSAPMLAMTCRSIADSVATPGPWYSITRLTPPFTPCRRSISRMTSFADTHGRSSLVSRTPQTSGIRRWTGSPAIARATSMPPTPIASIPSDPAAGVWLSLPTMVAPGIPNRSMWTGWETPLPGLEYQMPNRRHAERRNAWSSALLLPDCSRLWSTYCTDTSVRARSRPIASSSSMTMVPVASWVSVWSIRSPISLPAVGSPSTRWSEISFRVSVATLGPYPRQ